MTSWKLIFLQSRVNNGAYDGDHLPAQNWDWPLVRSGLSQAQFSNEQILIRIESIEHRVDSAPVSHVGQVFSVLQRSDKQLPLRTDLSDFLHGGRRKLQPKRCRLKRLGITCLR